MLIPKDLRRIVLEGLHAAHQGVSSMLANARERFFWPGLDAAVKLYRAQCRQCNEQAPSQPAEPPIESQAPEVPFQMVATDLCKLSGFSYLIYVDAYSGWVEVASLTSTNFQAITKVLLMYFALFGVPEEIAADGGPPFDSHDYTTFLKRWRIRRRLSSAYYPQSNGRAEAGVKTAKRILLGNVDPRTGKLDNEAAVRALMAHRNTPCQLTGRKHQRFQRESCSHLTLGIPYKYKIRMGHDQPSGITLASLQKLYQTDSTVSSSMEAAEPP